MEKTIDRRGMINILAIHNNNSKIAELISFSKHTIKEVSVFDTSHFLNLCSEEHFDLLLIENSFASTWLLSQISASTSRPIFILFSENEKPILHTDIANTDFVLLDLPLNLIEKKIDFFANNLCRKSFFGNNNSDYSISEKIKLLTQEVEYGFWEWNLSTKKLLLILFAKTY
ncbi:MAG: hypothetical protein IPO21_20615 [Bacteroidales bacterium]|nr:hypothetical protein [Bacteroidales bacterium]